MIYLRKAPDIENDRLSDHLEIIFKLNTSGKSTGFGFWKLNISLLSN